MLTITLCLNKKFIRSKWCHIFPREKKSRSNEEFAPSPWTFTRADFLYSIYLSTQIILQSMHKYKPRVHIIRHDPRLNLSQIQSLPADGVQTFSFPETEFTTVTAYQNQQVHTFPPLKLQCIRLNSETKDILVWIALNFTKLSLILQIRGKCGKSKSTLGSLSLKSQPA